MILTKYFCTIFIIDYNLISYTDNMHIKTRAVSLQWAPALHESLNIIKSDVNLYKKKKSV